MRWEGLQELIGSMFPCPFPGVVYSKLKNVQICSLSLLNQVEKIKLDFNFLGFQVQC